MFVCASCHAYVVVLIMCWLCFRICFFSIEFRNRFGVWGSVRLCDSATSRIRSSSERDLRQDDHFTGYHYYHCHARCLVSITCLATYHLFVKSPIMPWKASNSSTSQQTLFVYVTACSAFLIALLVAGANCSMCQHGCFLIYHNIIAI